MSTKSYERWANWKDVSGARSTKGCWTCRLRRKKCDENHPSCQRCTQLDIPCAGYGSKPPWMDRGALERKEAQSVKQKIAQSAQKKRLQTSGAVSSHLKIADGNSTTRESVSTAITNAVTTPHLENENEWSDFSNSLTYYAQDPRGDDDLYLAHSPYLEAGSIDSALWHSQLTFDEDLRAELSRPVNELPSRTDAQLVACEDADSEEMPQISAFADVPASGLNSSPEAMSMLTETGKEGEVSAEALMLALDNETDEDQREIASSEDNTFLVAPRSPVGSPQSPSDHRSQGFMLEAHIGTSSMGALEVEDALLLAHYTEVVLPIQFPFRQSCEGGGIQWLHFLLFTSKTVMKITLALASAHRKSQGFTDITGGSGYPESLTQAKRVLHSLPTPTATISLLNEEWRTEQAIIACACMLQVLHAGSSLWRDCLTGAAPYMQLLLDLVERDQKEGMLGDTASVSVLRTYASAARAIIGYFTWFDIIGVVSTGNNALLGIDHVSLLETKTVYTNEVSGCQNSVAKVLCEIASLRRWKKRTESDNKLNVLELATRGNVILQSLTHLIERLSNLTPKSAPPGRKPWTRDSEKSMTLAYARAAIIYLHATISGPVPHLEEIRHEVTKLTATLEVLIRHKTLHYASWPLCVMACFAVEHEAQSFLRRLEAGEHDIGRSRRGPFMEGLKIGMECRRIRQEEGRRHCDWMLCMKDQHKRVLLV